MNGKLWRHGEILVGEGKIRLMVLEEDEGKGV
jgi:hypothetical protein